MASGLPVGCVCSSRHFFSCRVVRSTRPGTSGLVMQSSGTILSLRVVVRIIYRPGHASGQRRKWPPKSTFLSMQAIFAAVAAFLYLGVHHPKLAPIAIPVVAAKESVTATGARAETHLSLRWNPDSPDIRDAASGELIVWEAGAEPRVFLLSRDELHHGSALYLDAAGEVGSRLFVIGKGSTLLEIPISVGADQPAE